MILSPARSPARLAGRGRVATRRSRRRDGLAGTQVSMAPTVVELLVLARPIPTARMNSSTKASAKCMNDPAASTIDPLPARLAPERARLVGRVDVLEAVIPTIFTKPPTGMRLDAVLGLAPRARPQRLAEARRRTG